MNKEQLESFESLFKVKTLKDLIKITKSETTTMPTASMHDRCLKFIQYGFEEGIKFATKRHNK